MYQANFEYSQRLTDFLKEFDDLETKISQQSNQVLLPLKLKTKQQSLSYAAKLKKQKIKSEIINKILKEEFVNQEFKYLLNYKKSLDFLDNLISQPEPTTAVKSQKSDFIYHPQLIIKIHQLLNNIPIYEKDITQYRRENLVLVNQLGLIYKPPASLRINILIEQYFNWLNKQTQLHPLIKSGLSYYLILAIYPFSKLNEEVSCLLSKLILIKERPKIAELISIERSIYTNQPEYYSALNRSLQSSPKIENQQITSWLEFFSQIINQDIKITLKTILQRPNQTPKPKKSITQQNTVLTNLWQQLTPRQYELLKYLRSKKRIKMRDAKKVFPSISEDSILRDLQALQKHGLIIKKGKTKGAYYQII